MTEKDAKECILTINLLRNLAYNIHGIMDVVDDENCKKITDLLNRQGEIVPFTDIDEVKCPDCKVKLTRQELLGEDVLFEDFFDYCPRCGRKVKWK